MKIVFPLLASLVSLIGHHQGSFVGVHAHSVSASDDHDHEGCAARDPSAGSLKKSAGKFSHWQAKNANDNVVDRRLSSPEEQVVVDTVFHVIVKSDDDGNLEYDADAEAAEVVGRIGNQMTKLNDSFSGTGFAFNHVKTTVTRQSSFSNGNNEKGMKEALHEGDTTVLNVWIPTGLPHLGYSSFPHDLVAEEPFMDGVVIKAGTMPGGNAEPPNNSFVYNRGATLVHEIGAFE